MKKEYFILALGDSYTIGASVPESDRWPNQLASQLTAKGLHVHPPEIIAVTGWTTDELLAGIDTAALQHRYDLVSVLIGVNNQYRGRGTSNYREELVEILEKAILLAGNQKEKVIVLSIPDWGVTPFAANRDRSKIAVEIDAFNAVKQAVSDSIGLTYIDITGISRCAASRPELTAGDGLHPSREMYAEWVQKVLPSALSVFMLKP